MSYFKESVAIDPRIPSNGGPFYSHGDLIFEVLGYPYSLHLNQRHVKIDVIHENYRLEFVYGYGYVRFREPPKFYVHFYDKVYSDSPTSSKTFTNGDIPERYRTMHNRLLQLYSILFKSVKV